MLDKSKGRRNIYQTKLKCIYKVIFVVNVWVCVLGITICIIVDQKTCRVSIFENARIFTHKTKHKYITKKTIQRNQTISKKNALEHWYC